MRAWVVALFVVSVGLFAAPSQAQELRVVVVLDRHFGVPTGPYPAHELAELDAFEAALAELRPGTRVSAVACDEGGLPAVREPVAVAKGVVFGLLAGRGACGDADGVAAALESLAKSAGVEGRVVVFASRVSGALEAGRANAEMVGAQAEHLGVAVHVVEAGGGSGRLDSSGAVVEDVARFLAAPTAASPPSSVERAVALRSGGSYHLRFAYASAREDTPAAGARERARWAARAEASRRRGEPVMETAPDRAAALVARAFGPRDPRTRRDALDDLADGRLRPSEVGDAALPAALHGVPLEPLLDAVFAFVDARRTVERAYAAEGQPPGAAGRGAAEALTQPRRRYPSRR